MAVWQPWLKQGRFPSDSAEIKTARNAGGRVPILATLPHCQNSAYRGVLAALTRVDAALRGREEASTSPTKSLSGRLRVRCPKSLVVAPTSAPIPMRRL
jgi:hypothetical protein